MSVLKEIKCSFCKKQFKTYGVMETFYCDHEQYEEMRYYPLPEENAHLVREYVCDNCYNNLNNIIKESYIKIGEEYINDLNKRKEEAYKDYLSNIRNLERQTEGVRYYLNIFKTINSISELDDDIIKELRKNYPYVYPSTSHLEEAIKIENKK